MKKSFLTTVALFTTIAVSNAQTEKGKFLIGGQLNLTGTNSSNSSTNSTSNTLGFQISPNAGYFVANNFAIGIRANFGTIINNNNQPAGFNSIYRNNNNSLNYGIGLFSRYYVKVVNNFSFFIDGHLFYNHTFQKTESRDGNGYGYNYSYHTNTAGVNIAPGFVYFVTPKLGIETTLGRLYYNYSAAGTSDAHAYGFNMNVSTIYLGLNYYF